MGRVSPAATPRRTTLLATGALLAVTACWGSTFFLIHDLLERVPTLDFLAIRFAIASLTLILLAPRALGRLTRYQDAVDELRRAVQGDPLTPAVHVELAFAAIRVGDFTSAHASWEHYLRLAPNAPDASRARAALETVTRLMHLAEAHADG